MASIYRPAGRDKYYASFRHPVTGRRVTVPGYKDRRATEALALRREIAAAREAEGLEPPRPGPTRTPAEFEAWLLSSGCCVAWARTCRQRVEKIERQGTACLGDLSPDTRRRYAQLLTSWSRFAGMVAPSLPAYSTRATTFRRRALTRGELDSLLATAPPHRALVYRVAAYTGLRRSELRRLRWSDLEADRVTVYGKAGRIESVPLHPSLRAALLPRRSEGLVFASVPDNLTRRGDYANAGVAVIEGRVADFHSLRYTFCTMLAIAGVNVWDAMKLMRHRDVRLTTRLYLDATQLDTEAAIRKLT